MLNHFPWWSSQSSLSQTPHHVMCQAISKALYITSHYKYKASEPLAILLMHIIGVLFLPKAEIAHIAKHRNILDREPRGAVVYPDTI